MTLPFDVARCVGRFGLGPDDPVCPARDGCERYTALEADRERWPGGLPPRVSVHTGLCRDDPTMVARIPALPLCQCWLAADGFVCRTPGKCTLEVS